MEKYSTSILCGGKSERMGTDKATLDWYGEPLVVHIMRGFPSCGDLFLSVRTRTQLEEIEARKVVDQVTGCGPLSGLAASLAAAKNDLLFVTTCDAPLVDERTADLLAGAIEDCDAVVPLSEDGMHPLIAVYRKSIEKTVVKSMGLGSWTMSDLLKRMKVKYYPAKNLPYGELTVANLNTMSDVAALKERIAQWK